VPEHEFVEVNLQLRFAHAVVGADHEGLEKQRGKVINFFKVLAYKPEILKTFLEFYQEVWREGKLPAVTKELAYLRTSILNGCAY